MTALLGFWALIPTRDKLYALLIAVLLLSFWGYTAHERTVGTDAERSRQVAAAAVQAKQAAQLIQQGATTAHTSEVRYVSTINAAIPDSPHLLVLDATGATAAVCAAGYPTERDDAAESSVEHPRDVGPDLDKIGRDSDAQVAFLQSLIDSCVKIGACTLTN